MLKKRSNPFRSSSSSKDGSKHQQQPFDHSEYKSHGSSRLKSCIKKTFSTSPDDNQTTDLLRPRSNSSSDPTGINGTTTAGKPTRSHIRSKRVVRFHLVEIREFERVVGDNPSCSSGVPVSIGWNHGQTQAMRVEDFEGARPPRRSQMDLVLTRGERHRLLVDWGANGQEVIESIRTIIRVKNQRRQTVNNLGSYDRVEEAWERLVRKSRSVLFRSSLTAEAKKLKAQAERATTLQRANSATLDSSWSLPCSEPGAADTSTITPNKAATAVHQDSDTTTTTDDTNNNNNTQRQAVDVKRNPPSTNVAMAQSKLKSMSLDNDRSSQQQYQQPTLSAVPPRRASMPVDLDEEEDTTTSHGEEPSKGLFTGHLSASQRSSSSRQDDEGIDDISNPQSHDHHFDCPECAAICPDCAVGPLGVPTEFSGPHHDDEGLYQEAEDVCFA